MKTKQNIILTKMKARTYKLTDMEAHTELCMNRQGLIKELTVIMIKSDSTKLILINDSFAEFKGFKNRDELVTFMGWGAIYRALELYYNPVIGKVQTFQDTIPASLN